MQNQQQNSMKVAAAKSKKDDRMTFAQTFVSGGISGVASRTITSPLDVVKILFQVGTKETKAGFMQSFSNIYKRDGLKGFWKGNGIACVRLFPYNAVQFAAFNKMKVWFTDPNTGKMSVMNSLLAGSLAGIAATVTTYPTDMVKTRLTADHADKKSSHAKYKGIFDCFGTVLREEGILAFYKGMSTSILGVIPFAGGTFASYEFLDKMWGKPKDKMTPMENFINGCLAASFAQTFSFPFDTVRKKLQAQSKTVTKDMGPDVQFNGMVDCFIQTIRQHPRGIFGLWSGTTANLAKVAPYAGIMFAAYEACKRGCLYLNGYTTSPFKDEPIPGVPQDLTPGELKKWLDSNKTGGGAVPPKH
jgi:solute carrier family 25 protein 43